ncbi:MAG TPA: AMP-binding protein [Vicinamibacteria bacterium]|nr:AMP-binding protein [Vicinamibacteria bacterium]
MQARRPPSETLAERSLEQPHARPDEALPHLGSHGGILRCRATLSRPEVTHSPPTLPALLAARALAAPGFPVLLGTDDAVVTAASLEARCRAFAGAAVAAGIRPGRRVLVAAPGGIEAAVSAVVAASFGEAAIVDPRLPRSEAARLLDRLQPAAAVDPCEPWLGLARERGLALLGLGRASGPWVERRAEDVAAALHTSGTSGDQRVALHTHRSLLSAARHGADALALGPEDRALDLRPGHHASSLVGAVLASLVSGGAVIRPARFEPSLFFDWLERLRPTWYTAAPAVHAAIAAEARRHGPRATSLRFVRSSAATLAPELAAELERLLGAPVLDGYGMTEVPLIASARLGDPPRASGVIGAPAGIEVAIRDGEVFVRGDAVMVAYDGDDAANAAAFADGWFRTGDLGALDADGRLRLAGREGRRINTGGEKVDPAEVEAAVRRHPAVRDAAVFAMPHRRLGEEVAAAVVREPGQAACVAELRRFVSRDLAAFKVPRRVRFVEAIPRDAQGKLRKAVLSSSFAPSPRRPSERPIAPDEERVARIWAETLGLDDVGTTEDFFDLGGDSFSAAAILARVEGELGARLPLSALLEAPTVEALTAAIGGVPLTSAGPAVVLRAGGSRPPFFCVHGIGGTAFRLAALAERLPAEQPFVALQAPGLDGRGAPLTSVEALAELYLRAVSERQPHGPYRLGGFCMGGAVAYEMARRLESRGQSVALLALIDPPPLPLGYRRRLPDRLRVVASAALSRLRLREPGPAIGGDESAVMQANRRALRRYRPGAYGGSARIYCASDGPAGAAEDAEASLRRLVRGAVHSVRLPGGHMDLMLEPGVARVAVELDRALRDAAAGTQR